MKSPKMKKLVVLPSSLALLMMGASAWGAAAQAAEQTRARLAQAQPAAQVAAEDPAARRDARIGGVSPDGRPMRYLQ